MKKWMRSSPLSKPHIVGAGLAFLLVSAACADTNCVSPPQGLLGWWPAEGTAIDVIGGNAGALLNGATYASGRVGTAFDFNGIDQLVQIPDAPALNPTNGLTLEAWVLISAFSVNDSVAVAGKDDPYSDRQYMLGMGNDTGPWTFRAHIGVPSGYRFFDGSTALQTSVWYHVAMTYDGASLKLYLNGALDGSLAVSGPVVVTPDPLLIGGHKTGPWNFHGLVDELSLYGRALSSDEIQGIYQAGSAGKCFTPFAPIIYAQPTNQTVAVGQNVTFTVGASGSPPLNYQWKFTDKDIPGATASTLTLASLQTNEAGIYTVIVSNSVGWVTSSNALLTVNLPMPCTPAPAGLISWWPGEGDSTDIVSGNNGAVLGGMAYALGMVGEAFDYELTNGAVVVPAASNLAVQSFTIECWVNPVDTSTPRPILEYGNPGELSALHLWYNIAPGIQGVAGALYGIVRDGTDPNDYVDLASPGGALAPNQWSHVAFTFDAIGQSAQLFVNGVAVASKTFATPIHPNTAVALNLGYRPVGSSDLWGGRRHLGRLDEVSIYNRALAGAEIQAIYAAGSAGKCFTPTAPTIYSQPASQTASVGQSVTFTVGAAGTPPLGYQWQFNGADFVGKTSSSLTLNNVQLADAGNYSVRVTNIVGAVVSSNAVLTVLSQRTNCVPAPEGLVSWWRAEGDATDVVGTNNGILVGDVGFAPGMVGQGFLLNGTNSYIRIPHSSSLSFPDQLTIELWFYNLSTNTSSYGLIGNRGSESAPVNYGINAEPWGLQLYFKDPTVSSQFEFSPYLPLPTPQSWHHVAGVFRQVDTNSLELRTYLDGALVRTGTFPGRLSNAINDYPVTIGASTEYPAYEYFSGIIDEVSIYNRALSADELYSIFEAHGAGKCYSSFFAPTIITQPRDQTATAGQTATFTVSAAGTPPLNYQWLFNGSTLAGATNSVLNLIAVQPIQAGAYSVIVSNEFGVALSSNALLAVLTPNTNCTPAPAGLVCWWPAESNAVDVVSGNNGALENGVTFAVGKVGLAFAFNGVNQYVQVPDSPLLDPTNALSIEAWVFVPAYPANDIVAIWGKEDPSSVRQYQFALWNNSGHWVFRPAVMLPGGYIGCAGTTAVQLNTWYHVTMTYDGAALRLYVNGGLDGSIAASGPISTTTRPLTIGGEATGPWFFPGRVDELSVYSRALSSSEIQSIFNAGSGGKCGFTIAPAILSQPQSQTAALGDTVTFNVAASGTLPLSYQWLFNGSAISGATSNSLVLSSIQMANAGGYSVIVSNAAGTVTSTTAQLAVNLPPAIVRVVSTDGPAGTTVSVPIQLVANGNENALGFSLNFSPSLLSYVGADLGSDASGASLLVNASQAANGILGLALAFPAGTTFAAGTQEIVRVSFTTAVSAAAGNAILSFGDQPTKREVSDSSANVLPATFTAGAVNIAAASFEADVSPRPNGDKAVTVSDWVLVGRYAARLDYPTNGSEFQRADCAPRATLGDGQITVADWVQAGRYATGLDPLTLAGGPTNEIPPGPNGLGIRKNDLAPRAVRVADAGLIQNQIGPVPVYLDAQGNENAIEFSLSFNTNVFTYAGWSLGADAKGATLIPNTSQAASGRLAFVLALSTGNSFAAGTNELLKVNLRPSGSASGTYPLALTDAPVLRQVVDAQALALSAQYVNGNIAVNPLPTLSISQSAQAVTLSWPQWANNFVLQQADGLSQSSSGWTNVTATVVTNATESLVTVPLTGNSRFYRLQQR